MNRAASIELGRQQQREPSILASDQFVTVEVADYAFAIPLGDVLEVEQIPTVAPVPASYPWVDGAVNLRGSVLTLIDLAQLLEIAVRQPTNASRMLVVSREDPVAIAVDRLRGMRRLEHRIDSPIIEHLPGRAAQYCRGLYRLDGEYVGALDIEKLLGDAEGEGHN
ncbi:MAG: chemotaxis protein CheW, partial [Chloroflexota bacterium]